jgi:hypothetical protein
MTTSSAEPRDVNIRFRYCLRLNNPREENFVKVLPRVSLLFLLRLEKKEHHGLCCGDGFPDLNQWWKR